MYNVSGEFSTRLYPQAGFLYIPYLFDLLGGSMEEKRIIMDEKAVGRAIARISYEIIEHNKGTDDLCIIGIISRGAPIGKRIASKLNELENAGLSVRGIKYRIGKNGQDYYGIIRRATAYGMQSVIIEHCYLDGPEDRRFLAQKDAVSKLGHADALALAKHLHLKSSAYGVDFSNYEEKSITYPVGPFD